MRSLLADFYHKKASALGPDPLREDADAEKLWLRMQSSKKPVGLMLMDQSAVAGVGNIYRAEILFKVQTDLAGQGCQKARALDVHMGFSANWNVVPSTSGLKSVPPY